MNGRPCFDTNIVLYAFETGRDSRVKIARDLLSAGGTISVQILNEFVSVARRKLGMSWEEVSESLAAVCILCSDPRPITLHTHRSALEISKRYGCRIYDALVIAAALEATCSTLYSEDMQNGQRIEGLTIRNPFLKLTAATDN